MVYIPTSLKSLGSQIGSKTFCKCQPCPLSGLRTGRLFSQDFYLPPFKEQAHKPRKHSMKRRLRGLQWDQKSHFLTRLQYDNKHAQTKDIWKEQWTDTLGVLEPGGEAWWPPKVMGFCSNALPWRAIRFFFPPPPPSVTPFLPSSWKNALKPCFLALALVFRAWVSSWGKAVYRALSGDRQVLGTLALPARAVCRKGRCIDSSNGSHAWTCLLEAPGQPSLSICLSVLWPASSLSLCPSPSLPNICASNPLPVFILLLCCLHSLRPHSGSPASEGSQGLVKNAEPQTWLRAMESDYKSESGAERNFHV